MKRETESKLVALLFMILAVVMAAGNVQGALAGNAGAPSVAQDSSVISLVQSAIETKAHSTSITVTLPKPPTEGDALVGAISLPTIGPSAPTVTGVVEGKAKWHLAVAKMSASRDEDVELWYTLNVDPNPKMVNVTFQLSNDFSLRTLAVVAEFSNIATSKALDTTGGAQRDCANTCAITSGTLTTSNSNELVVAFLGNNFMSESNSGKWSGSPSGGFKLFGGAPFNKEGAESDYKIAATPKIATTSDVFVDSLPFDWCGVVAAFFSQP